jgi:hypothetical protein
LQILSFLNNHFKEFQNTTSIVQNHIETSHTLL